MMNIELWIVLLTLVAAVVLFITEWLRVDVVALGVMLILVLTGVLTTGEVFAGFSSTAVLMITFLFVVGGGVWQTGLAEKIGEKVLSIAGGSEVRLLVVLVLAVAVLSSFMSNTGTVAVLLPAVVVLAKNGKLSPSKLLIPLSFGSMLGGALTLIGTPPNIVVNDVLRQNGLTPFGFFSFTPFGLVLLVIGVLFILVFGRHWLPARAPIVEDDAGVAPRELAQAYHLPERLGRLHLTATSPLVGKALGESALRSTFGVNVLKLMRQPPESLVVALTEMGHNRQQNRPRRIPIVPDINTVLLDDDVLVVEGHAEDVAAAAEQWQLRVEPAKPKDIKALHGRETGIAEVVLPPRSRLVNKTLIESHFGEMYHLTVLEVTRPTSRETLELKNTKLSFGDVLLVQGRWEHIARLKENQNDFVVIGDPQKMMGPPHSNQLWSALVILAGMVALLVWGVLPTAVVAMAAAVAMILTNCLTIDEAYKAIDWKSVVLIAGMLPMSTALEKVGLVELTADWLVNTLGVIDERAVLAGLFVLTAISTQLLSNTATAVILAPIAYTAAINLGVQPHAFLMTVAVAASMAFATPVASPTNTLVMGAGNYRFSDYFKVGVPLILISLVFAVLLLPIIFPLY